ncbi:hypothetical protein GCM10027563_16330 [Parasphingorhabdus pacifica]
MHKIADQREIGSGAAVGLALGVAFSLLLDEWAFLAVGIAIGPGAGMAIGKARSRRKGSTDGTNDPA